jgi:hypothetical protein
MPPARATRAQLGGALAATLVARAADETAYAELLGTRCEGTSQTSSTISPSCGSCSYVAVSDPVSGDLGRDAFAAEAGSAVGGTPFRGASARGAADETPLVVGEGAQKVGRGAWRG